jgi:hypothetical protein
MMGSLAQSGHRFLLMDLGIFCTLVKVGKQFEV